MMLSRPRVVTMVAVLLLAGCTTDDGTTPATSTKKGSTLQVKTQADAEASVKALAEAVATATGAPIDDFHTTAAPCDTAAQGGADEPWSLSGVANVAVKPADQVSTLTRLRDHWKQQGYEITEFLLTPQDQPTQGRVSARVPTDGLTVTTLSTTARTGFAIIIATPCYQPAPGENPGS